MLIFILLCFSLLYIMAILWKKRRLIKLSRNVPNVSVLNLLRSLDFLRGGSTNIAQSCANLCKLHSEIFKVWIGPELFYCVSKPNYLEKIFNSAGALDKGTVYESIKELVGESLLTSSLNMWKQHRKILNPAFRFSNLNYYFDFMLEECSGLIQNLEQACGQEIDPRPYFVNYSIDVAHATFFEEQGSTQKMTENYSKYFDIAQTIASVKMMYSRHLTNFVLSFTTQHKENLKRLSAWRKLTNRLTDRVLQNIPSNTSVKTIRKIPFEKYSNKEWSYKELRDEIDLFIVAATDTSATAAASVVTMLALHPKIQQKLYEEVMLVLGTNEIVLLSHLPQLKFLEQVIKETLRLYPVTPFLARYITEDIDLGDYIIPRGAFVSICNYFVHRNIEYWPDPQKFNPDRFSAENSMGRPTCTWLAFSAGPRNCIGFKYAMMTLKVMIVGIVQKFRLKTSYKSLDEIELTSNFLILKPLNGYKVEFERR